MQSLQACGAEAVICIAESIIINTEVIGHKKQQHTFPGYYGVTSLMGKLVSGSPSENIVQLVLCDQSQQTPGLVLLVWRFIGINRVPTGN